jgi:integrase
VLNDSRQTHPQHATAILTLLLTGCRLSEILTLKWSEIKGRRLLLTDSKTGPRTVWMGAEVRTLLDALPLHRDRAEVFWDETRNGPLSLAHFWNQWREAAGLPGVRLHDLRHSFASHAASMSETLPMIGKLLGHAKIASTARYSHLDDGAVLQAAERVGQLIRHRID